MGGYPYHSSDGKSSTCQKTCEPAVTVTGHTDIPQGDEDALKLATAQQPISIAIEADKLPFQMYKGGVLDSEKCGTKLDYGVLLVGYGTDSNGKDYWKVKNSWGATWGENGYIRIARGKNMCGIASMASYPTGAKAASPRPGPSPGPPPPAPTPPSPPAPSSGHYEDPKDGCHSDEVAISIKGVSGSICAPTCGLDDSCPSDGPDSDFPLIPKCDLKDSSSGNSYCALSCMPDLSGMGQCPHNASCKKLQGLVGICTYDDDGSKNHVSATWQSDKMVHNVVV